MCSAFSSSPSSPQPDLLASPTTLEILLTRYLKLLHTYQTSYLTLIEHFSSGYISLAAANFNARSHVRYNQDYYDARMQASTTVEIKRDLVDSVPTFRSARALDSSTDPLRWFGVLTPTALRNVQMSFTLAVTDAVPSLAGVIAEIKYVEAQVRALKAEIAVSEAPADLSDIPAQKISSSKGPGHELT